MRKGKEFPGTPHCLICGYTKEDAAFHLCRGEIPASVDSVKPEPDRSVKEVEKTLGESHMWNGMRRRTGGTK